MPEKKDKIVIEEYVDFIADHPDQLIIVCNPASDEMLTAYGGKASFVKFKEENHVILRVVSPDMFELSIDEFISGLIDKLKLDDTDHDHIQFIKTVGGSVKAVGKALLDNNEKHGKKESRKARGTKKGGTKGRKKGSKTR